MAYVSYENSWLIFPDYFDDSINDTNIIFQMIEVILDLPTYLIFKIFFEEM